MKKLILRFTAVVLVAAMAIVVISGCNNDSEHLSDLSDFIFVAEAVPIPEEAGDVRDVIISSDKLYLTSETFTKNDGENDYLGTYADDVCSMNFDGTGFAKLDGYTPPVYATGDTSASSMIQAMTEASDGSIWVVERWYRFWYDVPDSFDPERDNQQEYYVELESGSAMRKLDSATGAETFSVDISSLQGQQRYFFISSFEIDSVGNLYICADDLGAGGQTIFVLDSSGNLQFQLKPKGRVEELIRLPDGSVAITADQPDATGSNIAFVLQTIDFSAKDFGKTVSLPDVGRTVYPGNSNYDIFIGDYRDLYGYIIEEDYVAPLLSWMESDIVIDYTSNFAFISDEQIICTNKKFDNITQKPKYELFILAKTPRSELPEKTIITLGTTFTNDLNKMVEEFNRRSSDYRIYIIDYSKFNTEDNQTAGLIRFRTELITGKGPDIIDVRDLHYKEFAAKNLLTDLYPFIDSDPDINRDDFLPGVLRASELDGCLYQVFQEFWIDTLVGHPSVLGENPGWTMDELMAVLDANPGADIPLGGRFDKLRFMRMAVSSNIDEYIDWETGTANFDTPDFVHLMEYIDSRFPDEPDPDWGYYVDSHAFSSEAVAKGRQIMSSTVFFDTLTRCHYYKAIFGEEYIFKGFPSRDGKVNNLIYTYRPTFAILEQSGNKEAAWSFLRMILSEDWQSENSMDFPTNHAAFNRIAKRTLEEQPESGEYDVGYTGMDVSGNEYSGSYTVKNLTQEDVDKLLAAIGSASGTKNGYHDLDEDMENIINESASDFFSGACSAEDAARVIQSRMSILVSERS